MGWMGVIWRGVRNRRTSIVVLAAALTMAGCGGSSASAPAGGATPSPAPDSSSGPASPAPSPSSNLVVPHADPELEALLPSEFEGRPLTKLSVDPITSATGGEAIAALAKEVGDGSGNFSLAYASNPGDPSFNLIALRAPGAESVALAEGFAALLIQDTRGAEAEQVNLAGKGVTHVTAPGNAIGDAWFYAKGDTVFAVQAGSPEKAEALLMVLP